MTEARLIQAAETLARLIDREEGEQIAALRKDGFAESEAHRLVALLPMAFARPILEELGVVDFSPELSVPVEKGRYATFKLARQPEYAAALRLARAHRQRSIIDNEVYKRLAFGSADIDASTKPSRRERRFRGAA